MSRYLFVVALIGMFGILPANHVKASAEKTSMKEVKKETQDLLHALKSYTVDQRDAALQKTKMTLDKLDKRIEVLETRIHKNWENMDQAARKNARASLKSLRKQRTQVAEWYGSLKSGSTEGWDHIKQGFSKAYKALHKAWEKTENEFEPGKKEKPDKTQK